MRPHRISPSGHWAHPWGYGHCVRPHPGDRGSRRTAGRPRARSPDDRLGDLADALGLSPGDSRCSSTAGRSPAARRWPRPASCAGSRLDVAADPRRRWRRRWPSLVCEGGPASGAAVPLAAGRHIVGRSPAAAVPIDDPSVEPHHSLVEVDAHGAVEAIQLTGRVPCRVDGEPVDAATPLDGGATITLGSTRLRLAAPGEPCAPAATVATSGEPWRRTIHRTPRALPRWDPTPIPVPGATAHARPAGAVGLLAAGVQRSWVDRRRRRHGLAAVPRVRARRCRRRASGCGSPGGSARRERAAGHGAG